MRHFLVVLATALALALAPAPGARAATPLPEDAELDGLTEAERDIIREVDEIPVLVPDMDEELARRLSEADSFAERRRILEDVLRKFDEKYDDAPFINPDAVERVRQRLRFLFAVLRYIYYDDAAAPDFPDVPEDERRERGDVSPLTPAEKRALGIPLTDEEKAESGLDDLTPEEMREKGIPPRPGLSQLPQKKQEKG